MKDVLARYLENHDVSATVKPYPDYETLFSEFDSGKVDILAAEGDGAYGRKNAEVLYPFGKSDYFLCVSKKRKDILAKLNNAQTMLSVEEPNYLYSLKTKYYPVSLSARAFSAAEKEWLSNHDKLCVGYMENYLPYSDTDEQGNVTGIVKDLTAKIMKEIGADDLKVTYKGYASYEDMIKAMSSEKIDVAFPVGGGLYFSEENGIYQSTPIASSSTELIFKGEYTDDTVTDFAVNKNNRMQYYYVKTNFPDAKITFYSTIYECLDAVLAGEANCTTLNGLRANEILKNSKYKALSPRHKRPGRWLRAKHRLSLYRGIIYLQLFGFYKRPYPGIRAGPALYSGTHHWSAVQPHQTHEKRGPRKGKGQYCENDFPEQYVSRYADSYERDRRFHRSCRSKYRQQRTGSGLPE